MMVALVAAEKSTFVLLLEKTDKPGGSTAFSSRGIRAGGSRFQRALGIEYSPEQYARDILGRNSNESYLALPASISMSASFFSVTASARPLLGGRQTICDFLWEAVERESKIQVRFSTSVQSFQQENDGMVTGVVTDSGVLPAAKVILASGGFGARQELVS